MLLEIVIGGTCYRDGTLRYAERTSDGGGESSWTKRARHRGAEDFTEDLFGIVDYLELQSWWIMSRDYLMSCCSKSRSLLAAKTD